MALAPTNRKQRTCLENASKNARSTITIVDVSTVGYTTSALTIKLVIPPIINILNIINILHINNIINITDITNICIYDNNHL
jgi:hypothetical protein